MELDIEQVVEALHQKRKLVKMANQRLPQQRKNQQVYLIAALNTLRQRLHDVVQYTSNE